MTEDTGSLGKPPVPGGDFQANLLMKESELLVGIINRLGDQQGWLQRQFAVVWCTIMSAGLQLHNPNLALVAAAGTALTFYGEGRYVAKRRALRRRYERVIAALTGRGDPQGIEDPLSLRAAESTADWRAALLSPALLTLYGTVAFASILAWWRQSQG